MLQCKEGPLCEHCPKFERGIAVADRMPLSDPWPGLVLCGETPGVNEVNRGSCFVGQSGWLIEKTAKATQVNFEDIWVTNIAKCGLRNGKKLSDKEEGLAARCCLPIFQANMKEMMGDPLVLAVMEALEEGDEEWLPRKPSVVMALGALAWETLTEIKGILAYRGTIVPPSSDEPWHVVASLHPAAMFRKDELRPMYDMFCADFRKASQLAAGRIQIFEPNIQAATYEMVNLLLHDAHDAHGPLAIDLETHSGPGKTKAAGDIMTCEITCLAVTFRDESYCIPFPWMSPNYYTAPHFLSLLTKLRDMLEDPDMVVVFQNLLFDVPVLERCLPEEIEKAEARL